jgi:hypothetical protein
MKAIIPFGVLLGLVAFVVIVSSQPVQSNPHIVHELGAQVPGVPGPLVALNSCTVAVDDNPDGGTDAVACSDSAGHVEIFCESRSTTPVYYGKLTDDLDSVAPRICTDTASCGRDAFRFSVRNGQLGADTASGSVTLYCTEGR